MKKVHMKEMEDCQKAMELLYDTVKLNKISIPALMSAMSTLLLMVYKKNFTKEQFFIYLDSMKEFWDSTP